MDMPHKQKFKMCGIVVLIKISVGSFHFVTVRAKAVPADMENSLG